MAKQVNMAVPTASPLFLREAEIRRGVELLYFGYSHLTRSIDEGLAAQGLGRAHHRALYFVARQPDLTVGELIALLAITKQSLGRVLGDLTERGLIELAPAVRIAASACCGSRPKARSSKPSCSTRCATRCRPPIRAPARARSAASGRCSKAWSPRPSASASRRSAAKGGSTHADTPSP